MNKLNKFSLILALGFSVIACNNSPTENTTESSTDLTESTSVSTVEKEATIPKSIELICQYIEEDDNLENEFEVFLRVDGVDKKLGIIGACEVITKKDYEYHEIPANAVAACGGFYGGVGDYFYAIIENNQVAIYKGSQDDGGDASFNWEKFNY